MAYSNITINTLNTVYTPADLLAPPSLEGADIQISGRFDLRHDITQDTVLLMGHATTDDGLYEPRSVYNAQETINYLGADENSPLLRAFLQLLDGGCKNIVIHPIAPMSEYISDADLSQRFVTQDWDALHSEAGITFPTDSTIETHYPHFMPTDLTWSDNNYYERYYNRLHVAFQKMTDSGLLHGVGIIVPLEAPFYDTGGVDFAGQLVDLCYSNFLHYGSIACGIIGTRIQDFTSADADAMINDSRLDVSNPDYYLEFGKFVMVVVGEGIISHRTTSLTYRAPLDVQVAINLALFADDRSIAYSKLRGCVNSTYAMINGIDNPKVAELANARLNPVIKTAKGRRNFIYETRLATDNTLDKPFNPDVDQNRTLWSMTQTHLLAGIVNKIQEYSDNLIGNSMGINDVANFKSAIQQFMTSILSKGIIRDYSLAFEEEAVFGRITIKIGILPVFGLKHLYFEITTGPEVR